MKSALLFDFTVDKANNTINVKREFAANLELVWEAWTNPEILDQWWAPKPWESKTKYMDFKVGGRRFFAMVSPEGQERWLIQKYTSISPRTNFKFFNAFADKDENPELPGSDWDLNFSEQIGITKVSITIFNESIERMEKLTEGFKDGFTKALENLDQYIEAQFKLRKQNKTSNKARVSSYLNFDGKTEEAFLFYKKVFKTEFLGKGIERFGDIPASSGHPPVAEEIKKMVLHVELPITGNHILMGTDAPKEMGFALTKGNNMHICLEPETREEADRLFNELSAEGNITMPMADMFFGAYFGEFSDKYGINWMINFQNKQ
ncbi:MAG: SRPBCC domain-containing protein [Salinivirgaceae bacterium]|nr:SRPBCC domain-containing protein [Salinivirgaceae bacterium]